MCFEAGREECGGIPGRKLHSLTTLINAYETAARIVHPTEVIGVAMNGRRLSEQQAEDEKARVREETGLPVCDVIRDGPTELVSAVLNLKTRIDK